jgi:hypothetical protein
MANLVHKSLDNWYSVTCNSTNWFNEECRGFTQCGMASMSVVSGRPTAAAGNLTSYIERVRRDHPSHYAQHTATTLEMYGEMTHTRTLSPTPTPTRLCSTHSTRTHLNPLCTTGGDTEWYVRRDGLHVSPRGIRTCERVVVLRCGRGQHDAAAHKPQDKGVCETPAIRCIA